MKNPKTHLLFGIILISIGSMLLIGNFIDWHIDISYMGPGILMLIGGIFFILMITQKKTGAIFPGMLFFLGGLYLFLLNFPLIADFLWELQIPTIVLFWLGISFLFFYFTRPQEVGLLIPTAILLILGVLFLLNDLWIIDRDFIFHLWPLILILVGGGIVVHEVLKKPKIVS